jgi:hypothetical protein
MRGQALDFAVCPPHHRLQVGDKLLVYGVVGCAERVESGGASSVENPEHGEVLLSVLLDERP